MPTTAMPVSMPRFVALLFLAGVLTACTWVKPTTEGDNVRIVPPDRVADCKQIGDLSVYTKAKVSGVSRKASKVQEELETLARNEAAEMDGDTITASSGIVEGRQSYLVYNCQ